MTHRSILSAARPSLPQQPPARPFTEAGPDPLARRARAKGGTHRRRAAAVALACAVSLLGPLGAAPASAQTSVPTIANFYCESNGGSRYVCAVSSSGGVAPVTVRWFKNGGLMSAFNDRFVVIQGCAPLSFLTISVVITDSTSASASDSIGPFRCFGGPHSGPQPS
jgi:hypothetical protein